MAGEKSNEKGFSLRFPSVLLLLNLETSMAANLLDGAALVKTRKTPALQAKASCQKTQHNYPEQARMLP